MSRVAESQSLLEGRATVEGTRNLIKRNSGTRSSAFYRRLADGPFVSALGVGTYLGDCDDVEDARYSATALAAMQRGVNLLDTAINYRCQRSERALGDAVRAAVSTCGLNREEIVVCTKGGYIPLDRTPPATKEGYRGFLQSEYYGPGIMSADDVVAGGHCLAPRYLANQIERSRRNLGLAFIDVYYVHNPEQQLDSLTRSEFVAAMSAAFVELEEQIRRGRIGIYGCATWNGFRTPPESRSHLSLEELVGLARDAGGARHHFKVIQAPINLAMTEAVRGATQCVGTDRVSLLEAARRLEIAVVGSATLMQSQLAQSLPPQVRNTFPGFSTDARRAVAFSQSLPLVSALVGMKSVGHLEENLEEQRVRS
ncbi:MAG: aldo/keto reductase [Gemmatimonadaceae bacterium]